MPSEEWIRTTDERLSAAKVEVRNRPMAAFDAWADTRGSTALSSPGARAIFDWYKKNYPPDSFGMGSLFTGAFYFDQAMWPVHVPIAYGTFRIAIKEMVAKMTTTIGDRLSRDGDALTHLSRLAADCIDYGFGLDDLRRRPLPSQLARNMIMSADKELHGAVQVLLSKRPTEKVAESAAFAMEMFFKCYLAHNVELDEQGARKIGHDLDEGLRQCLQHDPSLDLHAIRGVLGRMPKVAGARYVPRETPLQELWQTYSIAQTVGACVIRSLTNRDCRPHLRQGPR